MSDNSKNKIYKGIGLIAGIIIIICCITLNIFTKNSLYNGKIANNIFIQGIDVSNMTKSEAIEVVNKKYTPQNLNLVYQDNSYEIDYKDIDLKYDTKNIVNKAYNSTRTGSYFNDITSYMNIKSSGKKYSIKVTYDENKLDKQIYKIANKINKKSKSATLNVGSTISYTQSITGLKFETEENKNLIVKALENKNYANIDIF